MLISSDETLRSIITNLQRAAVGQTPWVARLQPWLLQAELYLDQFIADISMLEALEEENPLFGTYARTFVAFKAWATAIPSLDLVATESGFGVVSTQTVAPASAQRVEAARKSAEATASQSALALIRLLKQRPEWLQSIQFKSYYENVFSDPETFSRSAAGLNTEKISAFDFYIQKIESINVATAMIEKKLLGKQATELLISFVSDETESRQFVLVDDKIIIDMVQIIAVAILEHTGYRKLASNLFRTLDETLQCHSSKIAEKWTESSCYKAYKAKPYENTKESSGFFF